MYLWTSEAVSSGHPDKVADQIADSILDAHLAQDPIARVASEVTIMKDLCLLSGEITSTANVDVDTLVRDKLRQIGYDRSDHSFNGNTVEILNKINNQSPQIANAVTKSNGDIGAGDQGLMFGFACDETPNFMPLAHHLSFEIIRLLEHDIQAGRDRDLDAAITQWHSALLPDAKSQITIQYDNNGVAKHVHTAVISTCHKVGLTVSDLHGYVRTKVVAPLQRKYPQLFTEATRWLINPAGLWTVGGPAADTGLSGRKIVVDNYGADCPIGGGSFSGKDPTKVDRSGAYAARHVAKNLVAAGIATRAVVQVSYAIGVVEPVSIRVQVKGNKLPNEKISKMISDLVDLTPKGIIDRLKLRRPIYSQTATGGHFGNELFPWEQLDLVEKFKSYNG